MSSFYGRTRDIIARAHETLERTAGIDADIAERRRLQELGLLPDTPPPPPEPTHNEDEIGSESVMSFGLFEGVIKEVIYLLRCEFGKELDALREEVEAVKSIQLKE